MQGATNVKNQRARQLPYSEYECDAHERGIKLLTARIAKVAQSSLREPRLNCRVGGGIMIAHNPLHGSGRADFPLPALVLDNKSHLPQRIGMTARRQMKS